MQEFTFEGAQSDMRRSYFFGAPGVLASGLVWLIASTVAALNSEKGRKRGQILWCVVRSEFTSANPNLKVLTALIIGRGLGTATKHKV